LRKTSRSSKNRLRNAAPTLQELCHRVRLWIEGEASTRIAGKASPGRDNEFEALALEVFRFQYASNPPYQAFCRARKRTPETVRRLEEIPAVVTSAFKELEFSCIPPAGRVAVFHSSGTTIQRPSRHFHSRDTLRLYETSLNAGFREFVLKDLERPEFLILAPRASEAPHSSLVHMFETASKEFGESAKFLADIAPDGGWSLRFQEIETAVQDAGKRGKPLIVCGTAFSYVHLCDWLADSSRRLTLPENSIVFETGGYKGRSREVTKHELYSMIQERLDVSAARIVSEYGMSELSSQAYDSGSAPISEQVEDRVFRFSPWARAFVVSPENGAEVPEGEVGLVRVYDLANAGSVIAIQTEDVAMRAPRRGFKLRGRAAQAEARGCSLMEISR
jgi:hypothetical protein